MRQVSVTIARAFFCQLITSDENKYFIFHFSSYAHMGVMYRARHLKERNIGQMLALIAKVVFFHRQRLVALNLVSESNRF